jgi:hypothetical protein
VASAGARCDGARLLGHFVCDVGTSGYVASPTLPHPRLHAVALFEGLGLTMGLDRRLGPFNKRLLDGAFANAPQPANGAAAAFGGYGVPGNRRSGMTLLSARGAGDSR